MQPRVRACACVCARACASASLSCSLYCKRWYVRMVRTEINHSAGNLSLASLFFWGGEGGGGGRGEKGEGVGIMKDGERGIVSVRE